MSAGLDQVPSTYGPGPGLVSGAVGAACSAHPAFARHRAVAKWSGLTSAHDALDPTRCRRRDAAFAVLACFALLFDLVSSLHGQSLGYAPIAVDSPVASRLAIDWREVTKPSSQMVCLYGHIAEASILVFDSEVLVQGDPATGCLDLHHSLMGAVGFIDGSKVQYSEQNVMDAMWGVLQTQTRWLFAGEVHGVGPALFPDGRFHETPLVWGWAREPAAGPKT